MHECNQRFITGVCFRVGLDIIIIQSCGEIEFNKELLQFESLLCIPVHVSKIGYYLTRFSIIGPVHGLECSSKKIEKDSFCIGQGVFS